MESKIKIMTELREKPAPPQISPNLFKRLMDVPEVEIGIRVYEMLNQKLSHWQFKCYELKGYCKSGLIVKDDQGKFLLKNPYSLFIYQGHADRT